MGVDMAFCVYYLRFVEFLRFMNKCFSSNWVCHTILPPNSFSDFLCLSSLLSIPIIYFLVFLIFHRSLKFCFVLSFPLCLLDWIISIILKFINFFSLSLKYTVELIENYSFLLLYISIPEFPIFFPLFRDPLFMSHHHHTFL